MADQDVYVDTTISNPTGDGTSGDPHDDLAAWEAYADGRSESGTHTCHLRGLEAGGSTQILVNGWDATTNIIIKNWDADEAAEGQPKGAGFTTANTTRCIYLYRSVSFQNIQLVQTSTGECVEAGTGATQPMDHIAAYFEGAGPAVWNLRPQTGEYADFTNCVFKEVRLSNPSIGSAAGTSRFFNCTASYGSGYSFSGLNYSRQEFYNCLDLTADTFTVINTHTDSQRDILNGVFAESDDTNNYDLDTGTLWASSLTEANTFEDSANGDYQLSATGEGYSDITDTGDGSDNNAPLTDANGVTRGTTQCSVGAFEPAPAGGGSVPIFMHHIAKNIGAR